MLSPMAAAAPLVELPPVTPLTLVRDSDPLASAEALVAGHRYAEAAAALEELWDDVHHEPRLVLRHRLALAWAQLYLGEPEAADELLEHAEGLARSPQFDAADRAEVLFRRGCVAFNRAAVADASELLTRALESNARAPQPRGSLAARTHEWRARCHVARRDWDAATRDIDAALDHAAAAGDLEAQGNALFQASIVAERRSQWLLARYNAEQALEIAERLGNRLGVARILNNLGGIQFLSGETDDAERSLLAATEAASEAGSDADLAQAVNSLAQVYLRTERPLEARARALRAVELLAERPDFLDELGNAQLVVARSHQAEGEPADATEWLAQAEATYARLGSPGHLATVWVAQGDLAREAGDVDAAADLYRRAAESLQDIHF